MSKKSNARLRQESVNAEYRIRRGANYFDFHLPPLDNDQWGDENGEYDYAENDCE